MSVQALSEDAHPSAEREQEPESSVVVTPGARETFTPRELADAYEDFIKRGPQYLSVENGLRV